MNTSINIALNMLYQRQITSREQLLNEVLRVKMVMKKLEEKSNIKGDKEKLFQLMKKTTEADLGFFSGDREDFWDAYQVLKDIDLVEFALEIYKSDRTGIIVSPSFLTSYMCKRIRSLKPQKILITEAEKHLSGLKELLGCSNGNEFTLTTQIKPMYILLNLAFGHIENVNIRFESIYTDYLIEDKYDYIYCLPVFGNKHAKLVKEYLTRESDGIALENMLEHLEDQGTLDIIVPARITFATMGFDRLRSYITKHFHVNSIFILPEGTFRPSTAMKTYLISITTTKQSNVQIGTFDLATGQFELKEKKEIPTKEFSSNGDWRVELLMAEGDESIQRFKSSNCPKVKLKDVAEVFRGKSILKKDTPLKEIAVLNISNIENGEIDYRYMDTIDEEERKIKRYELLSGDVVLTCRGTAIKSAVFKEQDKTIIASANLIVIRPKEQVTGEFIKIFLESPVGLAIIKSFQRGTNIMNINYSDIMEMEIPLLSTSKQQEMTDLYHKELNIYKETIKKAESRWFKIKDSVYDELIRVN